MKTMRRTTRTMVERAAYGILRPELSRTARGPYTLEEISALRADPFCVLANRSLTSQWLKCISLNISRDLSLRERKYRSPEALRREREADTPERRKLYSYRHSFRREIRQNPEPALAELWCLARGHQHAEDIVVEGLATMLRDCLPATEAFKLAKGEVNRTSAQPFREQSFNPDIDYASRETGRQVSKASDIRSARGEE